MVFTFFFMNQVGWITQVGWFAGVGLFSWVTNWGSRVSGLVLVDWDCKVVS